MRRTYPIFAFGAVGVAVFCLAAGTVRAAESNAVELRALGSSTAEFLATNAVSYAIDWTSGLVPAGATRAVLTVKGNHYDLTNEVSRSVGRIACTLFDPASGSAFNDTLTVRLAFFVGDVARSTLQRTYRLRRASFAQDRVLTVTTDNNLWRLCKLPLDLPFESSWFSGIPTYSATSNLVTGLRYMPIPPLDGPGRESGVLQLTRAKCGSPSRLNLKIWSGDTRLADINLDGRPGCAILVR